MQHRYEICESVTKLLFACSIQALCLKSTEFITRLSV